MNARTLVVDDERLIRWSLKERLARDGHEVSEAESVGGAWDCLKNESFDLILLDLHLPDGSGLTVLKEVREKDPLVPVIIITAYSSVDGAVDAMKAGAHDYITKPFNMDDLSMTVRRALDTRSLRTRLAAQTGREKRRFGLEALIGDSAPMRELRRLISKVAATPASTVLLVGESGTGKDLAAHAIHYASSRAERPFVTVGCTAAAGGELEAEYFGQERGPASELNPIQKGLLEQADEGTIYLDEAGDLPLAIQGKFLRVVEEKAFKRVGGTADVPVDIRVIAATHRNLDAAVADGAFREDLYYCLNAMPIHLAPLRDRLEDVPLLAAHFMQTYNREFHREFRAISADALAKLSAHLWPGNVRELRNVIERAVLLGHGDEIDSKDLFTGRGDRVQGDPNGRHRFTLPPGGCLLEDVERELVSQALERTRGNQTHAAQLLGVSRDQVRYKMAKFGIRVE